MSRISIAQLEALYWVAELGSVQRAAVKLNVAQPTLSLRLRQLQEHLAAPVLEPHGRGIRLTRSGHRFLEKAKLVLDAYAHLQGPSSRGVVGGVLRIGLAEGFAVACLPYLVLAFAKTYPLLRPEWTVTTSFDLEQSVVNGRLDLAVVVDPVGDRSLALIPLGLQANVWAGPPVFAARTTAGPVEMSRITVITTPPPTSMYRNTLAWFAGLGQAPGPLCICTSVNAAAQLASAGIGIGIFPARMIEAHRAAGTIVALEVNSPLPDGRV